MHSRELILLECGLKSTAEGLLHLCSFSANIHIRNKMLDVDDSYWDATLSVFHRWECSCGQGSPDGAIGRPWQATDIAVQGTECKWMKCCFMGVNSSTEGGHAFVKSLYDQYASWGVDFSESYNPCLTCTYLFVVLHIRALSLTLSSNCLWMCFLAI